jgi:tetratricopeptide (TPR) repeat protein
MLLKSAQDNYELKRYAEAVEGYNMFLEKYPRDPLRERVVYQLGNIYLEQGKTEKGIEIFEGFLNSFLHSKAENYVLFSLGRAYQKREEWDKAIARYNRILEDEKSSEDKSLYSHVLESLAFCYFKKGSRDRAAEEYFKLISRIGNADVPESVFLWLADYYWSIKDNDKSISVLKIFNQRYPGSENSAEVDYLLAKNYMDRGDVEETIRYFNSAISSKAPSPYMERSFLGLGQVYSEKGEYDKSLSYLEKAIEGNQDNRTSAFARFEIGNVYSSKKIYEEAAKQYMMVAILYDDKELCPAALYQAGISFSKAGKDKESDEAFKELIERYPGAPQAAKAEQYVR